MVLSSTYIASLWCIASVQIRNALALPGHFLFEQKQLETENTLLKAALAQSSERCEESLKGSLDVLRTAEQQWQDRQQQSDEQQKKQLKKVAMTGAAAKQAVVELKKKNAALEKENAEMQKKIPSTMDRLLEKKNLELLETRNFNLRQENKELKEALEEERSFSDRLLEGIDRVLDMLERHLPKQLLHLVDKARDLLPEHQTYRQEKQHERGHSWGDMSL